MIARQQRYWHRREKPALDLSEPVFTPPFQHSDSAQTIVKFPAPSVIPHLGARAPVKACP